MVERIIRIGLSVIGVLALIMCIVVVVWAEVANPQKARSPASPTPVTARSTPTPKDARNNPAIRAVMDYHLPPYDCTILDSLSVFLAIGGGMGKDVEIDGWYAIAQEEDFIVRFCFTMDGQESCLEWWHDPQKRTVSPRTVLTRDIQNTMAEFGCPD